MAPNAARDDGADAEHALRRAAGVALHDRLVSVLREQRPEALEAAEALLIDEEERRGGSCGGTGLKQLVMPAVCEASFSFNFG